jgi:Putative prokaryotic signal transducing protein
MNSAMSELLRTNDMVLLSFVEALLKDAGIACMIFDQNMSVVEGSLGVLPRRVLVDSQALDQARRLLVDAGLENDLK